jgi:peptide/nickel transport system substrate-binding protein
MNRFFLFFLTLSFLLSFTLETNASAEIPNPDVLVMATDEDFPTLDPAVAYENAAFRQIYVMYDRLVTYAGRTGEIQPMLAESWEVGQNGHTYIFRLHKDVRFHDGKPLTAKDVVYSFKRLLEMGKGMAGLFKGILDKDGITAPDESTVRFQLAFPYPPFVSLLGMSCGAILNSDLVKAHEKDGDFGERWLSEHGAGSGSYILKEWQKETKLVMTRNSMYWNGKPHLETVVIRFIKDPSRQRILLESGEVDMAEDIDLGELEMVKETEGIVVEEVPGMGIHFLALNTSKAPLSNRRVRQAIAMGIDFELIMRGVYLEHAIRLNSPIPQGMFGHDPAIPLFSFDPHRARRLLAEAGYSDGFRLSFLVYGATDMDTHVQIARAVQADLSRIGIRVDLVKFPSYSEYLKRVMAGEHDICMMGWSPDFADPDQNVYTFLHSDSFGEGYNISFFKHDPLDRLIEKARRTQDRKERPGIYSEIFRIAYEEVPYIWLAQRNVRIAYHSWVMGHRINPMMYWYIPFHILKKG